MMMWYMMKIKFLMMPPQGIGWGMLDDMQSHSLLHCMTALWRFQSMKVGSYFQHNKNRSKSHPNQKHAVSGDAGFAKDIF